MTIKKIIIGNSDYTRSEIEEGKCKNAFGSTRTQFLEQILIVERYGYVVKFKTNILRRIFCLGKYRVVAYKQSTPFILSKLRKMMNFIKLI